MFVTLIVYVDGILITGNHPEIINNFITDLNKSFSLKDLGPMRYFLGIEVTQTSSSIHLS